VGSVPTMLNTTLARRRRTELGLTLEQVGAQVGVSKQRIFGWETGQYEPGSAAKLRAYAAVLGVTVDALTADPEVAASP
jgi:transcriptional regulator with XRE-family HTH domain